jgi:hypothetical protein
MFNLEHIKAVIQPGERFVIVENGEARFVVLPFQDYLLLTSAKRVELGASREGASWVGQPIEQVNAELSDASRYSRETPANLPRMEEAREETFDPDPGSVRLEDLPL